MATCSDGAVPGIFRPNHPDRGRVVADGRQLFEPYFNAYRPLRNACGQFGLQCVTDARNDDTWSRCGNDGGKQFHRRRPDEAGNAPAAQER